jgi:hypothetical protein
MRALYWRIRLASGSVRIRRKIVPGQRFQLHPDRQAALQFRQHVGRLGHVEGPGGDEEDVVGLHRAAFGRNGRAFNQRQQVALHAFAADIGAAALRFGGDLVDLVEEDDAVVFHRPSIGLAGDLDSSSSSLSASSSSRGFVGFFHGHADTLWCARPRPCPACR